MATSALDAATDLTATITLDPGRARRQVVTFALVGVLLLVVAIALVPYALATWGFWFAVGAAVLLLLVVISAIVTLLRNPDRRLVGVSPRGVFVPVIADPIPWEHVAGITVLRSSARRGITAADRLASAALTAGGLNDGGRVLHVVLKDAAAWRSRLGSRHGFLVTDVLTGEQPGTSGFKVDLTQTSDAAGFEGFVDALARDAAARGVPMRTI